MLDSDCSRLRPIHNTGKYGPYVIQVVCSGLHTHTACLNFKNVTNLILNDFNKLEPISIIFAHSINSTFATKLQLYFLTEPPVNLLYLAISHSGVNDVSPLRHLFHRA